MLEDKGHVHCSLSSFDLGYIFYFLYCRCLIWNITIPKTIFFTIGDAMGCVLSAHTFYHPDLLAVFTYDTVFKKWYRHPDNINDPGWVRNSPLRNELVDLLNDATKAMGGWPRWNLCCCLKGWLCRPLLTHEFIAPMLVEPFNKVCEKFNDAKLFDMGLQCRAVVSRYKISGENYLIDGGTKDVCKLFVLVEKRSDEKLRDVGETLQHLDALKKCVPTNVQRDLEKMRNFKNVHSLPRQLAQAALTWSPPEDWMTRLTPPYNETTNHV